MKKTFIQKVTIILLFSLITFSGQAQYLFQDNSSTTSNGLGPYTQNFDGLAGTKSIFTSNETLLGVYAKFTLDAYPGSEFESSFRGTGPQAKLAPDNGSEGPMVSTVDADGTPHGASWYHFGSAIGQPDAGDRALGGIAATSTLPGKGYVGIRLKNASSKVIVNLAVVYAMEQWYNSSQAQAASVTVDYQRSTTAIQSLAMPNLGSSWLPISALNVPAPSTSTAIAPRNGNAATNRRVLQTTLSNLNLAVGEEIMIRFGYFFNSSTNGNGLSVDDVVITPETNVFYSSSASSSLLNQVSSWGTNTNGTGTPPLNFTADNATYYVLGTAVDRLNAVWTVGGTNSKVVVGTEATPATLFANANDRFRGTVNVSAGSTLQIDGANNNLIIGFLHPSSTVEYINAGTVVQNVKAGSYGTLKLSGTGPKSLAGAIVVNTGFAFNTISTSTLLLNSYDLLLLKGATLTGLNGANTLFVTNGKGSLRRTVASDGVAVLFPVGATATSYTPATLSQTQAQSEDSYSVRVAPETYPNYDATGTGTGTTVAYRNIRKTWFLAEEVVGNSNITLALQWNAADAVTSFQNATAHVNHYTSGAWDKYAATIGTAAGSETGSLVATRAGITSFSPFAVSSRPDGALPVELTAFSAQRKGSDVACTWATASEKNSRDFAIERSADGREFIRIGKVNASGGNVTTTYAFTDEQPLAGLAYYRLRQMDFDGTESFSSVVKVSGVAVLAVPVVVPNPGTGRFAVVTADGQAWVGPAMVFNALGELVLRLPAADSEGADARVFDLSGQPAGLYLVQLQTLTGPRTLRLMKN